MRWRHERQTEPRSGLPDQVAADDVRLSGDDLEAQEGGALPDKEAMSTITIDLGAGAANVAVPVNEALAANVQSSDSVAIADADQIVILDQTAQQS
jgi:hypothetical protein